MQLAGDQICLNFSFSLDPELGYLTLSSWCWQEQEEEKEKRQLFVNSRTHG